MPAGLHRLWAGARFLFAALLPAAAVTVVYALTGAVPLIQALEAETLTWRYRVRGPVAPGPEVAVIAIDDRSIDALGGWPLQRDDLARAIDLLVDGGARTIAIDLLFDDAETRRLPEEVVAVLREARDASGLGGTGVRAEIDRLLLDDGEPDRALAAALRRGATIVAFAFVFDPRAANTDGTPEGIREGAYRIVRRPQGQGSDLAVHPAGIFFPPQSLVAGAASLGHVTVVLDADGRLHRETLAIGYGEAYYPSLPVETVRLFLGLDRDRVVVHLGEGVTIGERFVATDRRTRVIANAYGPAGTFPVTSFVDLVEGRADPNSFRDRIVLIGTVALGIGDAFVTPFAQRLPGVEHYATVIDNILHDRLLVRNEGTAALDLIAILACGLITALAARSVSPAAAGLVTCGLVAGWAAICFAAFAAANLWLGFVFPTLSIVSTGLRESAARMRRERQSRREAERQRANLARYFSPAMVERLADSNLPFDIDRTQHAAIMFVDMVGSTRLTEGLTPSEAMDFLRQFHRYIEKAVFAHQGTLDRFLGDGAIACFGIPDSGAGDAYNAVACARALGEDIARWNEERGTSAPPVRIGIGLHYGLVLMGDIGGVRQFQFTIAGDSVNVASRLEGLTRTFDATIIASDAAIDTARAFADDHVTAGFASLPMQQIRGRGRPIGIWSWTAPDTCGGSTRSRETPQSVTLLRSDSARPHEGS